MELGLLVDLARKYWSVAELHDLLDLMSLSGLTHLQLHLSDDQAFRLAFDGGAGISVSTDNYCREEISALISAAKARGIQLVPEIEAPGHAAALLQAFPEFALPDSSGKAIDVTNPQALAFLKGIYAQVLDWFSDCDIIHIGGDEFIDFQKLDQYPYLMEKSRAAYGAQASGLEFYVACLSEIADFLTDRGKKVRVWNDGLLRTDLKSLSVRKVSPCSGKDALTENVQVAYWTNWQAGMAPVSSWIEASYELINFCDNDLYYVLGEQAGYTYPTVEKLKTQAAKNKFSGGQLLSAEQMKSVRGTYFSVWGDQAEAKSVKEILADLAELLPVFVEIYGE